MKKLLFGLSLLLFLVSCKPRVNPNEWVVSTGTCWNTMTVSKAGDIVPRLYTPCDRMVILPATELAADFTTETKFKNRVAGEINMTYQWRISDPIQFIQSAKSITSSSTDSDHKIDPDALEIVENAVVDKLLINLIREYTPNQLAGTDELVVERDLARLCKDKMQDRGVVFSNMSININFTPQIEEALDIISAIQFYESNGLRELGEEVIIRKAGAANITTNNK